MEWRKKKRMSWRGCWWGYRRVPNPGLLWLWCLRAYPAEMPEQVKFGQVTPSPSFHKSGAPPCVRTNHPEMGAIFPGVVPRVLTTQNEKSHGLVEPMEEYIFLIGRLLSHVFI